MLDEIVSIEKLNSSETIDITVSGNHLFYANDILTHNSNSDPGLEDTAESFGLPATADLMFSVTTSEALEDLGQLSIKQLKNRYNDPSRFRRFVVNVDKSRMRLSDAPQDDPEDIPVMDNTHYEERRSEDETMQFITRKAGRKDFSKLMQ